jgi:hypothetical protein
VCVRREWRGNETAAENEFCTRDKNALEGERDPKWRAWTVGGFRRSRTTILSTEQVLVGSSLSPVVTTAEIN